jgi:DNA-binding response OmpR family regulator
VECIAPPGLWLVLDSSGTRGSLNSLLLRAGYDVRSITGGLTLSALLTSGRASALFLGFQKDTISTSVQATCVAIRQTDPDIPLIVLGPSADIATKVGLFKLGADDYIEEPFDAGELVARLRSQIRRRNLNADRVHI